MQPDFLALLVTYPIFLFCLTIHEVAHALTAKWGGDLTATYQNRLSLNPLVHMDPVGTFLLPVLGALTGAPVFGWAKPVPVQEANFRDTTWNVVVALAGPFSNFLLVLLGAILAGLGLRLGVLGAEQGWWTLTPEFIGAFNRFLVSYIMINWLLILFNLIPVPPLDGSHVAYHFLIRGHGRRYAFWDGYVRYGFFILIGLLFFSPVGDLLGHAMRMATIITLELAPLP